MSEPRKLSEADELLAIELAFWLLNDPERTAAERRASGDAVFGAAVAKWRARASEALLDAPEAPPAQLWDRIDAQLEANDNRAPANRWRAAFAAACVAALLLGVAALRPSPRTPSSEVAPGRLTALLRSPERAQSVAVSVDPSTGRLLALSGPLALGGGSAELWVIPGDGRPRSLGVIANAGALRRTAAPPMRPLLSPGVSLAVSVEPLGGSRTGLPTGPVILTGKLIAG